MTDFYIYLHKRKDTEEIFYVGKGKGRRAYLKQHRNKYWHHIVNKYGYTVEIIVTGLTEDQAYELEKFTIAECHKNEVDLANMTEGGIGLLGHKHSLETKAKISKYRVAVQKAKRQRRKHYTKKEN